jgi:phospholipid/cholesterol/gamma-HCH transport system ATP-binding protein
MIEIIGLHKSFGGHQVLRGIELFVPRDKITVIIGPSGSGKTVLLRHMIGLLRGDAGKVLVDGVDIAHLAGEGLTSFRRKFGMLFQNAALFDSMNVYDNVAFPVIEAYRGKELPDVPAIVRNNLRLVGLPGTEAQMPAELSGGMKKRVGLARAIALKPSIILYDEPTTGLDPVMALAIDNLILSMPKELPVTSVVISHDIDSAFRIADQIAMIHDGKIVECATPGDFKRSTNEVVQRFLMAGGRRDDMGVGQ